MTKEITFYWNQSKELRTVVEKDGSIWFVANDVCQMLDVANSSDAIKALDEDEVGKSYLTDTLGRDQETNIISESGLYTLIIRSNKPQAKPFRRWVTHEVLPSIRKTGTYQLRAGRKVRIGAELLDEINGMIVRGDIKKMADELGLQPERISAYLHGRVQNPKIEVLRKMKDWTDANRKELINS